MGTTWESPEAPRRKPSKIEQPPKEYDPEVALLALEGLKASVEAGYMSEDAMWRIHKRAFPGFVVIEEVPGN